LVTRGASGAGWAGGFGCIGNNHGHVGVAVAVEARKANARKLRVRWGSIVNQTLGSLWSELIKVL
jgi:hypothetical protein